MLLYFNVFVVVVVVAFVVVVIVGVVIFSIIGWTNFLASFSETGCSLLGCRKWSVICRT